MEGYESFWACNDGAGNQRQGLNGVCTFVRKDLMVERACNTPLECEELDAEGLGLRFFFCMFFLLKFWCLGVE